MSLYRSGFLLFGLAATLVAASQPAQAPPTYTPKSLEKELIAVLNSKDESRIQRFIKMRMIPNAAMEQRKARYVDLAYQGAPFKVVRELAQTEDQIIVIVVDRLSNRIAMTIHFESKPYILMSGIQLAPAASVEGASADLASWKDLATLAEEISSKATSPAMGIAVIKSGQLKTAVVGLRQNHTADMAKADDVWSVGAIGKPICSSVIGRLIELGKLRWNETVKQALPGTTMNSAYAAVTIEQIMHHRGGIPPDLSLQSSDVERIAAGAVKPGEICDRYVRDILGRKPVAAPNARFAYSNAGYALLARIAERSVGRPYEQLVKDFVFKPLKLAHSFTGVDTLPKDRPIGYTVERNELVARAITGPSEAMFAGDGGGIFMSVGDLAKFGAAHLAGLRGQNGFLRADTVARLHKGVEETLHGGREYACGWGIETVPHIEPFHIHNGSNGVMRAELAIFPKSNLVIAAVVNRGGEEQPSPGMEAVLAIAARYASR